MIRRAVRPRLGTLLAAIVAVASLAGCTASARTAGMGSLLGVVAAENFWGSLAAQLGGSRVTVKSVIASPDTDPHSYEPTAADARAFATARFVIVNGVGYDPWALKMLTANPASSRLVLNVGTVVGAKPGANPHRWYAPAEVIQVVDQITAAYKRLSPADATYFDSQHAAFVTTALAPYLTLVSSIKARYAGTPVGASESIFTPLAEALGLDLRTPASFLDAISEGTEPTASDKATVDAQIRTDSIKVYVFNSQNSTPDVKAQMIEAKSAGIPVSAITETMSPTATTFQSWQVGQLRDLEGALAAATSR